MTFINYLLPEYERTCLIDSSTNLFTDPDNHDYTAVLEKLKTFLLRNEFRTLYEATKSE
jgi:hypothetical protein